MLFSSLPLYLVSTFKAKNFNYETAKGTLLSGYQIKGLHVQTEHFSIIADNLDIKYHLTNLLNRNCTSVEKLEIKNAHFTSNRNSRKYQKSGSPKSRVHCLNLKSLNLSNSKISTYKLEAMGKSNYFISEFKLKNLMLKKTTTNTLVYLKRLILKSEWIDAKFLKINYSQTNSHPFQFESGKVKIHSQNMGLRKALNFEVSLNKNNEWLMNAENISLHLLNEKGLEIQFRDFNLAHWSTYPTQISQLNATFRPWDPEHQTNLNFHIGQCLFEKNSTKDHFWTLVGTCPNYSKKIITKSPANLSIWLGHLKVQKAILTIQKNQNSEQIQKTIIHALKLSRSPASLPNNLLSDFQFTP